MVLALLKGKLRTNDTAATATAPPDTASVLTKQQLVERIKQDATAAGHKLTDDDAGMVIDLWARARTDADGPKRPGGRRIETLLTQDEMRRVHYAMDVLMPDEKAAAPGSVHDELDKFTFGVDPATGRAPRGVIHTLDSFDQCAVVVSVVPAA